MENKRGKIDLKVVKNLKDEYKELGQKYQSSLNKKADSFGKKLKETATKVGQFSKMYLNKENIKEEAKNIGKFSEVCLALSIIAVTNVYSNGIHNNLDKNKIASINPQTATIDYADAYNLRDYYNKFGFAGIDFVEAGNSIRDNLEAVQGAIDAVKTFNIQRMGHYAEEMSKRRKIVDSQKMKEKEKDVDKEDEPDINTSNYEDNVSNNYVPAIYSKNTRRGTVHGKETEKEGVIEIKVKRRYVAYIKEDNNAELINRLKERDQEER